MFLLASSTAYRNVLDPKPLVSSSILPCEDKLYVKLPCFDFAWSGNGSARIHSIVNRIMANNPGRPIPSSKVWGSEVSDFFSFVFSIFRVLVGEK